MILINKGIKNNNPTNMYKNRENDKLPLLKWPGGKRALIKHIIPFIPATYNHYIEPFFGGGALFFVLRPNNAILSDSNPELINCYLQVKNNLYEVIKYLSQLNNTEIDYYITRKNIPESDIGKAARLIYLTTLSFNGIYRLNLKGEFNVPYGYKTYINPCNANRIISASKALNCANIKCLDFEESLKEAKEGDLIYLDPPYTVAHGNNGFIKYNAKIFSWKDQIRLANIALNMSNRGCKVIISNANHPSILELYKDFNCKILERTSVIAAANEHRRLISECIFYN